MAAKMLHAAYAHKTTGAARRRRRAHESVVRFGTQIDVKGHAVRDATVYVRDGRIELAWFAQPGMAPE